MISVRVVYDKFRNGYGPNLFKPTPLNSDQIGLSHGWRGFGRCNVVDVMACSEKYHPYFTQMFHNNL